MLKLRRLRIDKFRSVRRQTELLFSDGINVLLGQNGTGKTTLLELISMIVRSDFTALANEDFAIEYELELPGVENLIVAVRNDREHGDPSRSLSRLGSREIFRATAQVWQGPERQLLLQYDPERGLAIGSSPPLGHAGVLPPLEQGFLSYSLSQAPSLRMLVPPLLQAAIAYRLDESLDFFHAITEGTALGGLTFFGDGPGLSRWFAPALLPEALIQQLELSPDDAVSDYSFTHDQLDFLSVLKDVMGFDAAELRIDVSERTPSPTRVRFSNLVFRFRWDDGTLITHEHLSYGQKRLVSFFYYLACNSSIVIADELVNGLHHHWITTSIEALGARQSFLTSQSPLLLDYVPITSVQEIERSFLLCRAQPSAPRPDDGPARAARPGWVWENMHTDDAQELLRAYGVGIEHVSEILQSRGLW